MVVRSKTKIDWEKQTVEIAGRIRQARESLGFTQSQFADQVSITRERLATYEDFRAPLRCDVGLKLCRQFFISEYWLAFGSVHEEERRKSERAEFSDIKSRMTMSLATEHVGLSIPLGISYAEGFEPHLLAEYLRLDRLHLGMPRVNPVPSDNPAYIKNAIACMLDFWKDGLTPENWRRFIVDIVSTGKTTFEHFRLVDPSGTADSDLKLFEKEQERKMFAASFPPKKR
jgi:transcriptional regulator with XRE-family HTH domain